MSAHRSTWDSRVLKGICSRSRHFRMGTTTYRYFMSTSNSSLPPSPWYMRWSMGVISLALIDWRTSTTV